MNAEHQEPKRMSDNEKGTKAVEPKYGRLLDDFTVGDIYHHPWEVTIDDGMTAMFAASMLDPNPLYSSRRYARETGLRDRCVHPLLLMNLALSFSVHDVSEQTIAHLAYINLRFPNIVYSGDTICGSSEVLAVRRSQSKPDRGIVHVRTKCVNQEGATVVEFERKALMPVGRLECRAHPSQATEFNTAVTPARNTGELRLGHGQTIPREIALHMKVPRWPGRPRGLYEDFHEGDVILHSTGRTIGESEHMQLAVLSRNSHPLHFDEAYSRERGFARTRVVEGGLVFWWAASLASRDTTANALWETHYDRGSHPAPVLSGDTLYAASRVIEKRDYNELSGVVRFHLVGVKNERPARIIDKGADLFADSFEEKVFEIERSVLVPRRSAVLR
jgi:2-methylfumaryl-CoA hydratase